MTITLKYYTDPGHGWFAVKRKKLEEFGLLDKVSVYSYQRGQTVYLEEDCDAGLYMKALNDRGVFFLIDEKHTNNTHPIRSYDRFGKIAK